MIQSFDFSEFQYRLIPFTSEIPHWNQFLRKYWWNSGSSICPVKISWSPLWVLFFLPVSLGRNAWTLLPSIYNNDDPSRSLPTFSLSLFHQSLIFSILPSFLRQSHRTFSLLTFPNRHRSNCTCWKSLWANYDRVINRYFTLVSFSVKKCKEDDNTSPSFDIFSSSFNLDLMISPSRGYDSLSRLFAISHSQLHYELEFVLSNLLYDHLIDPIFEVAKLKELFTIANFLLLPLSKFLIFPVFHLFNEYHYLTLVRI